MKMMYLLHLWPDYVYIVDVANEFGMRYEEFMCKLDVFMSQKHNKQWCNHIDYDIGTLSEILYTQLKFTFY